MQDVVINEHVNAEELGILAEVVEEATNLSGQGAVSHHANLQKLFLTIAAR